MELGSFFNPAAIAIVGVSENPKKVGYLVAKNCIDQGYKGELYFVNPKFGELLGKKVYKNLAEIGKPVDLAVLATPADVALTLLDEIGTLGIKNVVLYAAGFKETNNAGQAKEQLLQQKADQYGIRILGPNCIGFVNTINNANVTFLKYPAPAGNIGFISQSGALGSLMVDYLVGHKNFGFSYFISLGNKTLINECDALEFLADDPATQVIAMYLEDVKEGERFKKVLAGVSKKKPVVILKSGTTAEGSKAALSHTGSMMGNDEVYSAVFSQCGAIRAHEFYEFMAILKVLSYGRAPKSRNVLILSNAGGAGVLLTDEIIRQGLSLVTITDEAKKEIEATMGEGRITFHNPIDLLGDASAFHYKQAIASTIKEKDIGSVIILLTPQANTEVTETTQVIADAQRDFDKPIYPIFMGEKSVGNSHAAFEQEKIASFSSYDFIPKAIADICRYQDWRGRPAEIRAPSALTQLVLADKKLLNLTESMEVIAAAGMKTAPLVLVSSKEELAAQASRIGYPLVAKIASETITHKTDVKGVIPNIGSEAELVAAWDELTKVTGESRMYIQKMVKGYELILGGKRDPVFGPVVLLGIGGIYAELLKETVVFVHPFTLADVEERLKHSKLLKLMGGYRGSSPLPVSVLYDALLRLGGLMEQHPEIAEIDINPLIVGESVPYAVDGRVILSK